MARLYCVSKMAWVCMPVEMLLPIRIDFYICLPYIWPDFTAKSTKIIGFRLGSPRLSSDHLMGSPRVSAPRFLTPPAVLDHKSHRDCQRRKAIVGPQKTIKVKSASFSMLLRDVEELCRGSERRNSSVFGRILNDVLCKCCYRGHMRIYISAFLYRWECALRPLWRIWTVKCVQFLIAFDVATNFVAAKPQIC